MGIASWGCKGPCTFPATEVNLARTWQGGKQILGQNDLDQNGRGTGTQREQRTWGIQGPPLALVGETRDPRWSPRALDGWVSTS